MSVPEKDELIINLTVLSQLNKNRKISTKECFLNIEPVEVYIPESLRRWWRGDSREETLKKLDNIIVKAVSLLKKHEELIQYLKKSLIGLENLKQTYTECTQTNARLDVIIDKAKRGIEDYESGSKKSVKTPKKNNNKLEEKNDKKNYSSYSSDSDHDSENSDF